MIANLAAACRFLDVLDPEDEAFTFQYFAEAPGASIAPAHRHGRLHELAPLLTGANERGAGIFVTVNRTDGNGRTADRITALRSLFIDCDRPRTRSLALPPSMSIETSPGRGHHYWLLAPGAPPGTFRAAQEELAGYYGSDRAVTDLGRVLRLPGFWNMKRDPFQVRLVVCRPERRYAIGDVLAAHGIELGVQCVTPSYDAPRSCAERAYRRWSSRAPLTAGVRNRVAFRLALEGFRAGLDPAAIAQEVRGYCARAGIAGEAASVLRSARRVGARACTSRSGRNTR